MTKKIKHSLSLREQDELEADMKWLIKWLDNIMGKDGGDVWREICNRRGSRKFAELMKKVVSQIK